MNESAAPPARRSVRWTLQGRNVLLIALSGIVLSLPLPRAVLLAPMVALLALGSSALVVWWSARGLRVRVPPSRTVTVGEAFFFELDIEQHSRFVRLRDAVVSIASSALVHARPAGFCVAVAPKGWTAVPCRWRLARRGRMSRVFVTCSTTQPLGLFECAVTFELAVDWLALPALGSVRQLEVPRPAHAARHSHAKLTTAGDEEFHALREAREGDSPHLVHWRSSARRSRLVVRELRSEARPPIEVHLFGATSTPLPPNGLHHDFERAVSVAATVVEHFLRERRHVRFVFDGPDGFALDVRPSSRGLQQLLGRLATVQPDPRGPRRRAPLPTGAIVVGAGLPDCAPQRVGQTIAIDVERAELRRIYSSRRASRTTGEFDAS